MQMCHSAYLCCILCEDAIDDELLLECAFEEPIEFLLIVCLIGTGGFNQHVEGVNGGQRIASVCRKTSACQATKIKSKRKLNGQVLPGR